MLSYFIPICLMVLAAFALGVLVGRLAWGSPSDADGDGGGGENGPAKLNGSSDSTNQDLPVWRMKEVRSRRRPAQTDQP